jgi:hypothetical protein
MNIFAWILGLGAVVIILLIISYVFWLLMFIDAVKKRDILWIFLFIFCFFTGFLSGIIATIYYFVAYRHP